MGLTTTSTSLILIPMPRTSISPLGPRRQIGCGMTAAQRELIADARAAGWSKQEIVTKFLPLVKKDDLPEPLGWGEGDRKTVVWRLGPETISLLQTMRDQLKTTYPLLLQAACEKAKATKKPAI